MAGLRILLLCFLAATVSAIAPASAEDAPAASVGRIAVADGKLAVRRPGGEWGDAGVNDPVAAGTSLRTGAKDRAILSIGPARLALAAATELDLVRLDDDALQIVLHQGRIDVHLAALDPRSSVEVDLPGGTIRLLLPGDYDIAAGDAQLPGRLVVLAGATADDFLTWWRTAPGADDGAAALHHVSPEMTGYRALDRNGSWETVAGYGDVWFPTSAPADWAPYHFGHWHWIAPWGWTWVDDMEWGFAPSHYGRWARFPGSDSEPGRWGWVPGERVAHPLFMPAAVAFLGTAAVGISYADATGPAIAWFPLAPGEIYWPTHGADPAMIWRLNDGVAAAPTPAPAEDGGPPSAVIDGTYRNRRFASVVPRAVFVGGKPVAPALLELPASRLENAPLLGGSPQIGPPHPAIVAIAASAGKATAARKLVKATRRPARIATSRRATTVGHWRIARAAHPHLRVIAAAAHTAHMHLPFATAHHADSHRPMRVR
jgi:hypothetical protein